MQVRTPSLQHEVMIEAVENHMPQVIVIDEIGTELEAQAARTIAERGVQLIGTAHGNNLDNLMLNPTLSDLIGGIQSVTLGDEEARRRRTQKSVLERKAPPTFDVIVEIQDRERVTVHTRRRRDGRLRCCAATRSRPSCAGATRRASIASQGRPRPSPREQLGAERFAGLVGAGSPWRMEPGWRGDGSLRDAAATARPIGAGRSGPGYRPGASGGWRQTRGGSGRETRAARPRLGGWRTERRCRASASPCRRTAVAARAGSTTRRSSPATSPIAARSSAARPAVARDAGPRGPRARAPEGVARPGDPGADGAQGRGGDRPGQRRRPRATTTSIGCPLGVEEGDARRDASWCPAARRCRRSGSCPRGSAASASSRRSATCSCRSLIARDVDEADVVMTLKNEYKQKTPMLREAEERAMPIYVLKSNTIPQMQSSLTSIFSLEIDPREAAMRETEDAIEVVLNVVRAGRAVAAERLHPAAPAPDGRAGEPRLALARPGAVPAGPALPGRRPQRLALTVDPRIRHGLQAARDRAHRLWRRRSCRRADRARGHRLHGRAAGLARRRACRRRSSD